jgi:hypothetical protein
LQITGLPIGSSWFQVVSGPCGLSYPPPSTKLHLTNVIGKSYFPLRVLNFCLFSLYVIVSHMFNTWYPSFTTSHTIKGKVVPDLNTVPWRRMREWR